MSVESVSLWWRWSCRAMMDGNFKNEKTRAAAEMSVPGLEDVSCILYFRDFFCRADVGMSAGKMWCGISG